MERISPHQDTDGQVHAEQVALLYSYAPLTYTISLINGLILIFIQRAYIPLATLLIWFACLALVTLGRAMLAYRYSRAKPSAEQASRWRWRYLVGVGLSGIIWGSTALVLCPSDDIAHQIFVAFVLAGMTAAGLSVLASRLEAVVIFMLPTLLPLSVQFFLQDGELYTTMGMMTLLFLGGMCIAGHNMYRSILNSLSARFDNQALVAEIAHRRQVEETLFQEKTRLQITLASIGEGVVITDARAVIRYLNPVAEQLIGWSGAEARRRPIGEVFQSLDEEDRQPTATAVELCLKSARRAEQHAVLRTRDGRQYAVDELATPLMNSSGRLIGAVAVFRDVTEARRVTSQLALQANYDALTRLPNRHLLRDRLSHAIARAQRSNQALGVFFVDLDHFKKINDSLGHAAGDLLLQAFAVRLQACVRHGDTVARLGGDEFIILLEDVAHEERGAVVARKVIEALKSSFLIEGHEFFVTCSIGISLYPRDGQDEQTLLKNADAAMYRAKQQGRNNFQFYATRQDNG